MKGCILLKLPFGWQRQSLHSPLEPTLVILTQTDVPILLAFGHWMSGDDTHSDAAPRATRTETLAAQLSKPKSLLD